MKHLREAAFEYLETLRESGLINMYGSGPYLQEEFDITKKQARELFLAWVDSYGKD
tara:strand:- start:339 stop:506 length:168 start_codon:yes stop_codon:yes gene_type:complete